VLVCVCVCLCYTHFRILLSTLAVCARMC